MNSRRTDVKGLRGKEEKEDWNKEVVQEDVG